MNTTHHAAPAWTVAEWLNTNEGFSTADLAGRVVLAAGFQMLCPGCVEHTIPQLRKAAALFSADQVAVVGLHTVFEHHDAMTPTSLRAFLHEYKITFPVAIDAPSLDGSLTPITMTRYRMQGTPTTLLFDKSWNLRRQSFGHVPDMQIAAEIVDLMHEAGPGELPLDEGNGSLSGSCDDIGCRL